MRSISLLALAVSAVALAGCQSSGGGDAPGFAMCGVNCNPGGGSGGSGTGGGGTGGGGTGGGGGGTDNTGNGTQLSSGDTTIVLESSVLTSPDSGSLSQLTFANAVDDDGNPTTTAKMAIDTKTDNNSGWPKPKTMDLYQPGIDDTTQPGLGGTALVNNPSNYQEYRKLTSSGTASPVDEELQVWNWQYSYGTQYRDVTGGGGEAIHQAWSFGGSKTAPADMPTNASATYNGRFGSTAKTTNWQDSTDVQQTISHNGLWQVNGSSQVIANFGAQTVKATLTPEAVQGYQTLNGASGFLTVTAADTNDANYFAPVFDKIQINAGITGNTFKGTAKVDPTKGWISGDNPAYGAFFGPAADETTGVFAVYATMPGPRGGNYPINGDRRGYLQHSGVFNACKPPGGACPY